MTFLFGGEGGVGFFLLCSSFCNRLFPHPGRETASAEPRGEREGGGGRGSLPVKCGQQLCTEVAGTEPLPPSMGGCWARWLP